MIGFFGEICRWRGICRCSHIFYMVLLMTQLKLSKLGWLVTLILTIDTHMDITWLNFHLSHTPFKKIKTLMGKSLSLADYNEMVGTSFLPYQIQYSMLLQEKKILKQSYQRELSLKVTYQWVKSISSSN